MALEADERAVAIAADLKSQGFLSEAEQILASLAEQKHELQAEAHVSRALTNLRSDALPLCQTAEFVLQTALRHAAKHPNSASRLFAQIAQGPLAVFLEEALRRQVLAILARGAAPAHRTDYKLCVKALELTEPYPVWGRETLMERYKCYAGAQHPLEDQARKDLARFEANEMPRYL